ncbi:MAG: small conductance mechanosensitive channel [Candidatus Latescibacterota bacterium]|jgi:small conductance mechanosensitive channel
MEELISKASDDLAGMMAQYGLQVIGAIAILILGRIAAGIGRSLVQRMLERAKVDAAVVSFISSLFYFFLLVCVGVATLANFGVQTASVIAVLGAAGFAVGLALQGSLSNFAAGVMILVFRPFKVDDFIDVAGVTGTVKDIDIFTTTLASPDNVKIMVPNGQIYGSTIKNFGGYDTRRVDMVVGIGYSSSIEKAVELLEGLIAADERVLKDPAPQIAVAELADSSVNLVVRPWVNGADYWGFRFEMTRKIKESFDANSIEIPFPQMVVHKPQEG